MTCDSWSAYYPGVQIEITHLVSMGNICVDDLL